MPTSSTPFRRRSRSAVALTLGAITIALLAATPAAAAPRVPTAFSAGDFPANPTSKPGCRLVSSDEFSGSTVDTTKWVNDYLPHWTTPALSKPNFTVSGGNLNLQILQSQQPWEPTKDGQTVVSSIQTANKNWIHNWAPYSSLNHSVPTDYKQAQRYGYFEIRAKAQAGSGHHSAFWMVGTQPDQGTSNGVTQMASEIDIFEILGNDPTKINFNLHPFGDPKLTKKAIVVDTGVNLTAAYHVYGLAWEPGSLKLYFDNQLVAQTATAPDYPMLTLLGLYEKRQGGWTGAFDANVPYPKSFSIDYYRAYQPTSTLPTTIQAETADVYAATRVVRDSTADGGTILGWLGNSPANTADFRSVYVPTAGTYTLSIRYRTGEARNLGVRTNQGTAQTLTGLNSGSWSTWATTTTTVTLKAGDNQIELLNNTGYAPDIDWIRIS